MKQQNQDNIPAQEKHLAASSLRPEAVLGLLNLAVIAALLLVHTLFISLLGPPSRLLVLALTLRFLLLLAELFWLQKQSDSSAQKPAAWYFHYSLCTNIAFAFLASYLGGAADSHYSVLMVLPIIAAAARLRLPATLGVVGVAIGLTFLEVWLYFRRHPPADSSEYFESATVSLIFLVVALVVWALVQNLKAEEEKLRESLTAQQRLQERLVTEEKLAAIGRLSSAIAHEIRNPVAMISSSLVMGRRSQDAALKEEMFSIAEQEAARLESFTTEFLTYAHGKAPDRKLTAVAATLGYVASLVKARAEETQVTIEVLCDESLQAQWDDFQMQQALLNLLTNALQATPAGGKIVIGAMLPTPDSVQVFVENDGEPIPADAAARVFEPFFTTKKKGTGLGLAIVRNIAQAHQGGAELTINERGRVRFTLTLPTALALEKGEPNGSHSDRG